MLFCGSHMTPFRGITYEKMVQLIYFAPNLTYSTNMKSSKCTKILVTSEPIWGHFRPNWQSLGGLRDPQIFFKNSEKKSHDFLPQKEHRSTWGG